MTLSPADLTAQEARLQAVTHPINPYVTDKGGVVVLNGPFPIAQATAIARFIEDAPFDLAACHTALRQVRREREQQAQEITRLQAKLTKYGRHLIGGDGNDACASEFPVSMPEYHGQCTCGLTPTPPEGQG